MNTEQKAGLFQGAILQQVSYKDELLVEMLAALRLPHLVKATDHQFPLMNKTQQLILRDKSGKAVIIWKKQKISPGLAGVRCLIFINISKHSSSELLLEAMKLARICWLSYPLFLHFNPRMLPDDAIQTLKQCGWKLYGTTSTGEKIYVTREFEVNS